MDTAGQWLSACRSGVETVSGMLKQKLAPVMATADGIKSAYQPLIETYKQGEAALRSKMNTHLALQAQLAREAREQVAAEVGAGHEVGVDVLAVAHGVENVALPVGMGARTSWAFEVADEGALRRAVALQEIIDAGAPGNAVEAIAQLLGVPGPASREWLTVDGKFGTKFAREHKQSASVPGVAFAETHSVTAARTKKN